MNRHRVSPEVSGGFGARTEIDRRVHPPRVDRLHFVFSGWLGDDLVESFPCFLVSGRLAREIASEGLTGVELADVEVSVDPQFTRLFPEVVQRLPVWRWLRLTGREEVDDFWVGEDGSLCLNDCALMVLQRFELGSAEVTAG